MSCSSNSDETTGASAQGVYGATDGIGRGWALNVDYLKVSSR